MGLMVLSKEEAKKEIKRLVEKYNRLIQTGDSKKLTEEETKKDFILPLFHAINWDTQNSKEVSAEETISKKRVDYGFRIDGIPKFFLETKPFKEKLQVEYAEQAINYSWLKSTTWAVLTNFDELKVFNAEWKSRSIVEKLFFEIKWSEFEEKFDKLWLLSRDSFLQNELDRTAEEWGKKQKKTPVTPVIKQLFDDLMVWRQKLTKNINGNKTNMNILKTEEALDESVQRILDRLIFIRVCEDKELEPVTLLSKLREWKGIDRKGKLFIHLLNDVFREFDKNYNSKLFSKHPCEDLIIDDIILNDIIHGLYENSDKTFKYDFSAIDADVLGNIYEEYLGYVLKKGKATENGLHRKEMGIYYTPTFVVDYIVRNTLGEMIKQIKPKEVEDIKVLDMACGSGSFLLEAFDFLVNYHKTKNELSFLRKIKILTDNIYAVDLDPKAIEIAQLNLLLKTLERRRLLPKLQENLKVGNSLIDDKIFERAFNWNVEFENIINNGGFDVIIGNPPYVESRDIDDREWEYYRKTYPSAYKRFDLSVLFVEKSVNLLKNKGLIGMIISNKFTASDYGYGLRKFILDNCSIKQIIDVSNIEVFKDASTYPYIIILQKEPIKSKRESNVIEIRKINNETELKNPANILSIKQSYYYKLPNLIFSINLTSIAMNILDKLNSNSVMLKDLCEMKDGIHTGNVRDKLILNRKINDNCKKLLTAESIDRYSIKWNNLWVNYDQKVIDRKKGEYGSLRDQRIFEDSEKLITALFGLRPEVAYDNERFYANNSVKIILPKRKDVSLKYILAILNSNLMKFYYKTFFFATHVRGGYIQFYPQDFLKLPIKKVVSDKQQKEMIELVDRILELNKELQKINKLSDKGKKLQEEIQKTDKEIDQRVYELYGLTPEEIKIVENS